MIMSTVLYKLYRIKRGSLRNLIVRIICLLERREFYSKTLRKIFKDYYGVEIGMYTHGGCFVSGNFACFTTIGRYCSIGGNVKVFNRNHPMDFKSMHGFFFNPILKYTKIDLVEDVPVVIGNDVWIGDGAKIMPQVTNIGDGAVVAAGAVVNKDIPPYAVVVGNPARIVRYRFSKEVIEKLLEEKWWEKDIDEILPDLNEYQQPYEKLYFDKKNADSQNK